MDRRHGIRAAALGALLLPLAVSSAPPTLFWYLHIVPGHVLRAAGSPGDHTVVLFGRHRNDEWRMLGQCAGEGAERVGTLRNVILTGDDGRFQLAVSLCDDLLDSLAAAVVYPDTVILGERFSANEVAPGVVTATCHEQDGFFCEGNEYECEDGYVYRHPEKTIVVP